MSNFLMRKNNVPAARAVDPWNLLDRFFENNWGVEPLNRTANFADQLISPLTDVIETDKDYQFQVEIPGLTKDNITIELQNNLLTISGERKDNREETNDRYHLTERRYGTFSRSFRLPETVADDKVEATYTEGILKVIIPKKEASKAKAIKIN